MVMKGGGGMRVPLPCQGQTRNNIPFRHKRRAGTPDERNQSTIMPDLQVQPNVLEVYQAAEPPHHHQISRDGCGDCSPFRGRLPTGIRTAEPLVLIIRRSPDDKSGL